MATAYTVFIDESFDGFMNLSRDDGYFCYAALMVPTARLGDLGRWPFRPSVLASVGQFRIGDSRSTKLLKQLEKLVCGGWSPR
jgi:hypothetical protein